MARSADASRARIWSAAATEFGARGFEGAKVDRIALAAKANKAMIYYHFKSKAGLYNAILHDTFAAIVEAIRAVRASGGTAESQLRAYVEAVARVGLERPYFPSIWLRELADGGRHLDPAVATFFREVLTHVGDMLREGAAVGTMRPVHPFLVQMGIVGPLTLFIVSQPLRARFAQLPSGQDVTLEAVIQHVQTMVLGGVARQTP
jgi:AcrR family transcriptional regulator